MNIILKRTLGASLVLTAFSFIIPETSAQSCTTPPTCESLGYTETTACEGGMKCPFDDKWNCTASNLAKQLSSLLMYNRCNIGDIFYSDKTCSSGLNIAKTPIGIVVYIDGTGHGVVMGFSYKRTTWIERGAGGWGDDGYISFFPKDIPNLPNKTTFDEAIADFDSCENTKAIIDFVNNFDTNISNFPAAQYTYEYSTEGTNAGDWCLPSAGILQSIYKNTTKINTGLKQIGANQIDTSINGSYLWSSTEYNAEDVWVIDGNWDKEGIVNAENSSADKDYSSRLAIPVLEF